MDAWLGGVANGLPAGVDIRRDGAGQAGDGGAAHLFGDGGDGLQIAGGRGGEAGLDEVHPQPFQGAAISSFSSPFRATPGDCSPSLRVVSNIRTLSVTVGSTSLGVG